MIKKTSVLIVMLVTGMAANLSANEGFDFSKLSVSVNVIPKEMNRDVSD